jgi:hypothetical protein
MQIGMVLSTRPNHLSSNPQNTTSSRGTSHSPSKQVIKQGSRNPNSTKDGIKPAGVTHLAAGCDDGASSPWRSSPLRRRATVLSLAGVETDAEAEGAAPPLSEGEPPPPPVDAEWAAPPEVPAPETIASSDRPELERRRGEKP